MYDYVCVRYNDKIFGFKNESEIEPYFINKGLNGIIFKFITEQTCEVIDIKTQEKKMAMITFQFIEYF
jgi:hypothetical protein